MKIAAKIKENADKVTELKEYTDKEFGLFAKSIGEQLKKKLAEFLKVEDFDKAKLEFLPVEGAITEIEKQIAEKNSIQIGRWMIMIGNNSHDFYIKDLKLNGYYRLGTTDQKIRLDAASYIHQAM